mmetsp:Transcript_3249/g.10080  ORF Transcript_3249/g.10080 Transcript_3249/m.10080 type:complete len:426 (-) Transcript_3249:684-1961(-)
MVLSSSLDSPRRGFGKRVKCEDVEMGAAELGMCSGSGGAETERRRSVVEVVLGSCPQHALLGAAPNRAWWRAQRRVREALTQARSDGEERYAPPFVSRGLPGTVDADGCASLRTVSYGPEDVRWLSTFERFFEASRGGSSRAWEASSPEEAAGRSCSAVLALARKFFKVHGRTRVEIGGAVLAVATEAEEPMLLDEDDRFYLFVDCRRSSAPPESVRHLVCVNEALVGGMKRDASLETAWFPNATRVLAGAFDSCDRLALASLPTVGDVQTAAFYGCSNLRRLHVPAATSLCDYALCRCLRLPRVALPRARCVGKYCFYDCHALATVDLPAAATVGAFCFRRCLALTAVHIPNATSLGTDAFKGCKRLQHVTLRALYDLGNAPQPAAPEALANALLNGRPDDRRRLDPDDPLLGLPISLICHLGL